MFDTDATLSPGYTDAVTLPAEEKSKFKVNQPQFHWNLVTRLGNQIREKTGGETEGWRQMVMTLLTEKSWLILERGNTGEPYGDLRLLIEEAMGLEIEDFTDAVARFAGPDMVDMLRPHLPDVCDRNSHKTGSTIRKADQRDREASAAPEIAIRLRAADLITQRDMESLGKLNANDAHQETLELIIDRLNELETPPPTASSTDRRHFRAQVKAIIQHVLPKPEPQARSKVVRFPDNAERALAIIQEHLSIEELGKLKLMLCSDQMPEKKPRSPRPSTQQLSYEEALEQVTGLADGAFTTTRVVMALIGETKPNVGRFNNRFKDGGDATGNGWVFKKHTADKMTAMGFGPKAASWEVIEYGQ